LNPDRVTKKVLLPSRAFFNTHFSGLLKGSCFHFPPTCYSNVSASAVLTKTYCNMTVHFTPEINSRASSKGDHAIQIRCTQNRKHKRVTIGIAVPKDHWDTKKHCVKKKHPMADQYNRIIQQELLKLQKAYATLLEDGKDVTLDHICQSLQQPRQQSFYEFAEQTKLREFQTNGKLGTLRRYQSVLEKLKDYAGPQLTLRKVDYSLIRNFEQHLLIKCKNGKDTVSSNLSVIRSILNEAIRRGQYTDRNPFNQVQLRYTDNTKAKLTLEELKRLEQCPLPPIPSLQIARDFFLACFYAGGCRGGDMVTMRQENILDGTLAYQQQKTGSRIVLPICEQLQRIIERNRSSSPYLFPLLKEGEEVSELIINSRLTYVNKYLREVCKYAGILKKISTHCARHSFTDIALSCTNENIFGVKDVLGHSSVKVTELYARGRANQSTFKMVESIYSTLAKDVA
jgi:integrase/recombinase XerD